MNQQRSLFFNVDWISILLFLALCTIGWFNIHDAVLDPDNSGVFDFYTIYGKQFVFIISSILI